MTQPVGSGMPDENVSILENTTNPNLVITEPTPQIGEPQLAGENPDFTADYIFCNNLYVKGSILPSAVSFPLLAPSEKPIPYSFSALPQSGMYIHYEPNQDSWQTHFYARDPSWYDADLFSYQGTWNMNAPGGGIQLTVWGSDANVTTGQRWYAYLLGRKGANAAGIGMGGQPNATAGVQMPFWIENQLYSDIVFKTVYAGGFGNVNWLITGDNTVAAYPTGGHIVPGATNTYDIGSPTLRVRNIYISGGLASFTVIGTNGLTTGQGGTTGNTLYGGSGAPSAGTGNNGDYYFRSDTPATANQRLYVKSGGAWTGIV